MIKPDAEFNNIIDINFEFLKENNIKGLILDVDNTLIDLKRNKIEGLDEWLKIMIESGIKIAIVSNGRRKEKINVLAKKYGLFYICFALKPFKIGIEKVKNKLNLDYAEIAEIGDQLFTDVLVSNKLGMFSILTNPVEMEKSFFQRLKRKTEENYKIKNWRK